MTTPAVEVLPDIEHESTHWAGGTAQETGAWCFAAAAQTVQSGFGVQVAQAEIAHQSLLAIGATGVNQQGANNATTYHHAVAGYVQTFELPSTNWSDVSAYVTADDVVYGYVRNSYGEPRFAGRTVAAGGRLTTEAIMQTITDNGLVVKGNVNHYTVIYGYRRVGGAVEFHVYNPLSNASSWITTANVTADMQMSYRVTA